MIQAPSGGSFHRRHDIRRESGLHGDGPGFHPITLGGEKLALPYVLTASHADNAATPAQARQPIRAPKRSPRQHFPHKSDPQNNLTNRSVSLFYYQHTYIDIHANLLSSQKNKISF
ncbi:hypothetical protein [Stutzerimonas kirkiae]|uniref:hypothetical protein n=1 Tax=Stutzerimonas kirkiae TaxID=2211392 RepID=UPI00103839CC|nr:hypothetical protein [Stutzerimonas kirkiae]